MEDADRFKLLFGPYQTPRFRYGQAVSCQARGEVTVCGLTDATIPWPVGKRGRARGRQALPVRAPHWPGRGLGGLPTPAGRCRPLVPAPRPA
jgi:hypothetical protein